MAKLNSLMIVAMIGGALSGIMGAEAQGDEQCATWVAIQFDAPTMTVHYVYALNVWDDGQGGGPMLYAGGEFVLNTASGQELSGIARWNGSTWMSISSDGAAGVTDDEAPFNSNVVRELLVVPPGSGTITPGLYAAGNFDLTYPYLGPAPPPRKIARWTGTEWTKLGLGSGISNGTWYALALYTPPGGQPALYAGGLMGTMDGISVNSIARWNGSSWSSLPGALPGSTHAMAVFDDGSGPALFVDREGSIFQGQFVQKWNGSSWTTVGQVPGAVSSAVRDMAVWNDGRGTALYVAGSFASVDDVSAPGIARWDGATWSAVGATDHIIDALAVYDDGKGSALYAGGGFSTFAGIPAKRIAKWDGAEWSIVGPDGLGTDARGKDSGLETLHAAPAGDWAFANVLFAGGRNLDAGELLDQHVARAEYLPSAGPADLFCDFVIDGLDLAKLLGAWGDCRGRGDCPADLDALPI